MYVFLFALSLGFIEEGGKIILQILPILEIVDHSLMMIMMRIEKVLRISIDFH